MSIVGVGVLCMYVETEGGVQMVIIQLSHDDPAKRAPSDLARCCTVELPGSAT